MGDIAVIPVRAPGKSRLGAVLAPDARVALSVAMLSDVVAALRGAGVARIVVAAADPATAAAAGDLGVEVHPDPPDGDLNTAVDAACAAVATAADRVLVVAADLPYLTAVDVGAVLTLDAAVVVAPTADGGTGGLLRHPPDVIPARFGPGSARRHLVAARARGVAARVVDVAGFRRDVDTPADLEALDPATVGAATAAVLGLVRRR